MIADAPKIELVQYHPGRGGTFTREWSYPRSDLANSIYSVTSRRSRRKDAIAIHYSKLKDHPEPTAVTAGARKGRK